MHTPLPLGQRGFSLVEIMVGVLIGLLAVLVIYQVFTFAEGVKRNTTGAADAQQNGLFSTFTLGLELANAGNGIAVAGTELDSCPRVDDIKATQRPLAALITDGSLREPATPDTDAFVVNYGVSPRLVSPGQVVVSASAGNTALSVQSPGGFKKDDLVVAISRPKASTGAGTCERSTVTAVSAPDANGIVTVTVGSQTADLKAGDAVLLNLGPTGQAQRVLYDVRDAVLRSTDQLTVGAVANPLASNIVVLKAQYGIDANNDGFIDDWVAGTGDWAPERVLAMPMYPPNATSPVLALSRIKAIRIGLVVRSDQYDRNVTDAFEWVLFDCPTHDAACAGRLTGTQAANWRYRVYETVVPLRNQIWNPAS